MVINHLAQAINYVIMATVVAVSVWFVGGDARRRALPWPETAGWTVISILTFPIGFGVYFLMRPRTRKKSRMDGRTPEL